MSSKRTGKLSFKGDKSSSYSSSSSKSKKKKRSHSEHDLDHQDDLPDHGWVQATKVNHLEGPIVILFPGTVVPSTLYNPTESNHAVLRPLEEYGNINDDSKIEFHPTIYEPSDVHQIFVIHKLVGSSTGDERWSIKSAEGRFLTAEKSGMVTCATEAVGPKQEWNPIFDQGTRQVAFQSVWGGYLTVDKPNDKRATWVLGCKGEDIGYYQSFCVKVQAQVIHEHGKYIAKLARRRLTDNKEYGGTGLGKEVDIVKKYQSWGGGRVPVKWSDPTELMDAKKRGKLAETLLDRRATQKSDKYCK